MPPEQKQEPDKILELNIHYYHPPKLHAFEVGHGEPRLESMVGLGTWADRHPVLRPVVNIGHKNQGDSQVACMNLGFVNHLVTEHCLRQAHPVGARRSVRRCCLRDLKKFRDDSSYSTRQDGEERTPKRKRHTFSIALLVGTPFNPFLPFLSLGIDTLFGYAVLYAAETRPSIVAFFAGLLAICACVFDLTTFRPNWLLGGKESRRIGVNVHRYS